MGDNVVVELEEKMKVMELENDNSQGDIYTQRDGLISRSFWKQI